MQTVGRNVMKAIKTIAALFFVVLLRGEIFVDAFKAKVSKDVGWVLMAIIILFVACLQMYTRSVRTKGKV